MKMLQSHLTCLKRYDFVVYVCKMRQLLILLNRIYCCMVQCRMVNTAVPLSHLAVHCATIVNILCKSSELSHTAFEGFLFCTNQQNNRFLINIGASTVGVSYAISFSYNTCIVQPAALSNGHIHAAAI